MIDDGDDSDNNDDDDDDDDDGLYDDDDGYMVKFQHGAVPDVNVGQSRRLLYDLSFMPAANLVFLSKRPLSKFLDFSSS